MTVTIQPASPSCCEAGRAVLLGMVFPPVRLEKPSAGYLEETSENDQIHSREGLFIVGCSAGLYPGFSKFASGTLSR